MSDNANLLDIYKKHSVRRFMRNNVAESAVVG